MESGKMSSAEMKGLSGPGLVGKGKKEASVQTRNTEYFCEILVRIRPVQICCEKSDVMIWNI